MALTEEQREYQREYARQRYKNDPEYRERIKRRQRGYYQRYREKCVARARAYRYRGYYHGLSQEEFEVIEDRAGGRCESCGDEFSDTRHRHFDHCHQTGVVRGLLCVKCNHALGYLGDGGPDTLLRIEALRQYALDRCPQDLPSTLPN